MSHESEKFPNTSKCFENLQNIITHISTPHVYKKKATCFFSTTERERERGKRDKNIKAKRVCIHI